MLVRMTLAVGVILGGVVPVGAQVVPLGHSGLQQMIAQPFQTSGVIDAMGAGQIQLVSDTNQRQRVSISPQTKVEVTGTATADFLGSRMFVRFNAKIDGSPAAKNKGIVVKEKISQLTLFSPSQETPLGLQASGGLGEAGTAAPSPDKPSAHGSKKPRGKAGSAVPAGAYSVAGQITGVRDNEVTVNADGTILTIEVAEDAKIDVKVADLSLARQGDRISARGHLNPTKPGVRMAEYVKIEAAAPFAGVKPKSGKSAAKREPRPSKKAAPENEPPAETPPANP